MPCRGQLRPPARAAADAETPHSERKNLPEFGAIEGDCQSRPLHGRLERKAKHGWTIDGPAWSVLLQATHVNPSIQG